VAVFCGGKGGVQGGLVEVDHQLLPAAGSTSPWLPGCINAAQGSIPRHPGGLTITSVRDIHFPSACSSYRVGGRAAHSIPNHRLYWGNYIIIIIFIQGEPGWAPVKTSTAESGVGDLITLAVADQHQRFPFQRA